MNHSSDITLCSVSYRSREFLIQNRALTARLNPEEHINWVVIENTPPEELPKVSGRDGFDVVPGSPCLLKSKFVGSYHHAQALNEAIKLVKTRHVVIVDPDFFVVRPQWLRDLRQHVTQCQLAFFGAPYFPDRWFKYRYFPCAIFLWIDLDRVNSSNLDFSPEIKHTKDLTALGMRRLLRSILSPPELVSRSQVVSAMERWFFHRYMYDDSRRIGRFVNPDVGIRLFRQYAGDQTKRVQCLTPSWQNPLYNPGKDFHEWVSNVLLRNLVPDRWLRSPRQKGYCTSTRFCDCGYPDLVGKGWEEYFWDGRPFGFHIRGVFQGLKSVDVEALSAVLRTVNIEG